MWKAAGGNGSRCEGSRFTMAAATISTLTIVVKGRLTRGAIEGRSVGPDAAVRDGTRMIGEPQRECDDHQRRRRPSRRWEHRAAGHEHVARAVDLPARWEVAERKTPA